MSQATLAPPGPEAGVGAGLTEEGHHVHLWVLYAVLFSSTCIVVGLIWDISWHMTIGRDTLWSPPHVLEQIGASVAGLSCGAYVLWTTFAGTNTARARSVRFWGFQGPLGAWVCIWGALTMIVSVPFDDWWHNAYGLDVQILSPPHTLLLAGMLGIQIGALLFALAAQNTAPSGAGRRYGWLYAYGAGILLVMGGVMWYEHIGYPNEWHSAGFYRTTAAVFPLFLAAVGRAARLRWPATAAAATYMGILLAMMWILQLFPAQPMLAPIYNPVDHMVPLAFPLVLVAPAFAMDWLLRRFGDGRDWLLAGALAVAFVAIMVAVHWPFADFMLGPGGRNWVFGADQWPYTNAPGPWRYEFWGLDRGADGEWSATMFASGLAFAAVVAFVSARVGLWWGGWMRKVVR